MSHARASGGVVVALSLCAVQLGAQQAPRPELKKEPPARSAAEVKPDEELLEFLGSFDTEDKDWVEYLTDTDIARPVASAPARAAPEVKKDEKDE